MTVTLTSFSSSPTCDRWDKRAPWSYLDGEPLGFEAGDANVRRYVGNGPTNATDPSGLQPPPTLNDIAREGIGTVQPPRPSGNASRTGGLPSFGMAPPPTYVFSQWTTEEREHKRILTPDEYFRLFLAQHPGLRNHQLQGGYRTTLDMGCIGITLINLGGKSWKDIDFSNAFAASDFREGLALARRELERIRRDQASWKQQKNMYGEQAEPRIIAVRFWTKNPSAFVPDRNGRVDMSKFEWPRHESTQLLKPGACPFDFGFYDEKNDSWWHANTGATVYRNEMRVYESSLATFNFGYRDFNRTIFVVTWETRRDTNPYVPPVPDVPH